MRLICPLCFKKAVRVIIQYPNKPQVEACCNCRRVVFVEAYDLFPNDSRVEPREMYILKCEEDFRKNNTIQNVLHHHEIAALKSFKKKKNRDS